MLNTMHLLLVTMVSTALGTAMPSNSQASALDYVYPKYAIQYLGLGDYKPQLASTNNNPVIYVAPDEHGLAKYITYTNDGANVYEVTVQVKPGSYPVISSTPVQSKPSAANEVKDNDDSETKNNAAHSSPPGNSNHQFSEDAIPMTLPPSQPEEPETTTCQHGDSDDGSTEQPAASKDGNPNNAGSSDTNATPVGNSQHGNHMPAPGTRPQYFPSLYGAMSFYPVAYNPFTGQVKYAARPMGAMTKLPATVPTAQGEKTAQMISTTLKPFAMTSRPSPSMPVAITTSPIRVKPVPYAYPYVSYQSKNSRIVYQVPAQQMNAMPSQAIQWVQALPVARFPTAYPQGYYQPAVLTLSAQPPPSASLKLSATPTVHTSEAASQA